MVWVFYTWIWRQFFPFRCGSSGLDNMYLHTWFRNRMHETKIYASNKDLCAVGALRSVHAMSSITVFHGTTRPKPDWRRVFQLSRIACYQKCLNTINIITVKSFPYVSAIISKLPLMYLQTTRKLHTSSTAPMVIVKRKPVSLLFMNGTELLLAITFAIWLNEIATFYNLLIRCRE